METITESTTLWRPIDTEPDYSHRLPTELWLDILKRTTDFTTLWSIINTSSQIRSIFNKYAIEIIHAILDSSVPSKIQSLMSAIIGIRTNTFQWCSWEDAHSFFFRYGLPPIPFPDTAAPVLLWKFVHLAHDIRVLAHSCIFQCIQRCTAVIPSADLETPSFIEEQRAIFASWSVQLFYELDTARIHGSLNWPFKSLSRLRIGIDHFALHNQPWFLREQVFTVLDFIDDLRTLEITTQQSHALDSSELPTGLKESTPPSHMSRLPKPPTETEFRWTCQARPSEPKQCDQLDWSPGGDSEAPGLGFFHRKLVGRQSLGPGGSRGTYTSGIKSFVPFRNLGFALWDESTMKALGCWSDEAFEEPLEFIPIWRSILSRYEEIERATGQPRGREPRTRGRDFP